MTDIEQVIIEILTPHGFIKEPQIPPDAIQFYLNTNKILSIQEDKITLYNIATTDMRHNLCALMMAAIDSEITIDLCDPNSLRIIEDWAKS